MSGTSRRRGTAVAASLAVAVALGTAGCAADAPTKAELTDALVTSGLPPAESRCAAAAIVDNASTAEIEDVMQRGGSALVDDPKRTDDSSDKVRAALAECRDAAIAATSTTAPPSELTTSTTAVP